MKIEKLKRNFWLTSEIECMLNLIKDVQMTQGTTTTTHYTFVQIANKMKKKGFPNKSPTQIRRKWFQMKSAYLCYKRGNADRLLLIPEKFRGVIAEFVDTEFKSGNGVQLPSNKIKAEEQKVEYSPSTSNKSTSKNYLDDFVDRVQYTYKILNENIKTKQKALETLERECQEQRDRNLILFVKQSSLNFEISL